MHECLLGDDVIFPKVLGIARHSQGHRDSITAAVQERGSLNAVAVNTEKELRTQNKKSLRKVVLYDLQLVIIIIFRVAETTICNNRLGTGPKSRAQPYKYELYP